MLLLRQNPRSTGQCDTAALARNVTLGRKHNVTGTPALVFEDGKRIPGALSPDQVEERLASARKAG